MEKNIKYYSRLYKGFLKMMRRQDAKPEITKVDTGLKTHDFDNGGYMPLMQEHWNNKWNGMNLKTLASRENTLLPGFGMYSNCLFIKSTGHYKITINGKRKLQKLREKRNMQPA